MNNKGVSFFWLTLYIGFYVSSRLSWKSACVDGASVGKYSLNENFIEFFMHLQLQISLLKIIYNWLLDTLYITLHMDLII
jgi:hypothetical protein